MNAQAIEKSEFPVAFREWICWADCTDLPDLEWPGVFALAVFSGIVPHTVDLESDRICYIGSACTRTLGWELQQFKYKCPAGINAGGCERLPTEMPSEGVRLWVSVFPVSDLQEPIRSAFIRHVERELIWRWVSRHGRFPDCNPK